VHEVSELGEEFTVNHILSNRPHRQID